MHLLNRYAAVVFYCLLHTTLLAGPPTAPFLTEPADHATKVSLYQFLRWETSSDPDGNTLLYDIYLGDTPAPPLFRENLYDGWTSGDGMEMVALIQILDENDVLRDHLDFLPFTLLLTPETTYYWKVVARDTQGNEVSSEVFSFTTARINSAPSLPVQVSPVNNAVNINKSNVTLMWQASIDAEGDPVTYRVYAGTSMNSGRPPLLADGITTTSYTFPADLADQQVYYWQVAAVDGYDQEIVWSSGPQSFRIENYTNDTPEPPVLLYPANGSANTTNSVKLTWKASPDKDGDAVVYDVYADKNANPTTQIATGISQNYFTAAFPGIDAYYWKVVARDPQQASSTSASVFSFKPWRSGYNNTVEMIAVEGGTFTMGQDSPPVANEGPAHTVTVHDFEISKYPITYRQYAEFLNAVKENIVIQNSIEGHRRLGFYYKSAWFVHHDAAKAYAYELVQVFDATEDRPIDYETHFDSPLLWNGTSFTVDPSFVDLPVRFTYYEGARIFAAWCGYSLPSEAEWEYSASGGKYTHHYLYSGSNDYNAVAAGTVVIETTPMPASPVGTKLPNELGLYDMTGPIGEICLDYYDLYRESTPSINPVSSSNTDRYYGQVYRGIGRVKQRASSHNEPLSFRVAKRSTPVFIITGKVTNKGNPWPGLNMEGLPMATTCDRLATYFCPVPAGWSGTIMPVLEGYSFTPQSITITNAQGDVRADFTMEPLTYRTVYGKITNNAGEPVANAKVTTGLETAFTQSDGTYFIEITTSTSARIQPELSGYTFSPAYIDVTNITSNLTDQDFTATHAGTFTVAGVVKDEHEDPLENVVLSGFPSEIMTGADGKYTIELTAGWSGTITPVLENYTFTPSSLQITGLSEDLSEKDFTGTYTGTYIISGRITVDDEPVKDITITNASATSKTDDNGYYAFIVPSGWSGTITPSSAGHSFVPASRTFDPLQDDQLNQDFTATVITGIEEPKQITHLYPNPSSGTFTVTVPPSISTTSLTIITATGAIILEHTVPAGSEPMEVTIPHAGMYLLRINGQGGVITEKVIVK